MKNKSKLHKIIIIIKTLGLTRGLSYAIRALKKNVGRRIIENSIAW
jgi:hypothetical protein